MTSEHPARVAARRSMDAVARGAKHALVVAICAQLNIIWDDADELARLARLSHPRVTVDTAGLAPSATELANLLAERIRKLPPDTVERLLVILKSEPPRPRRQRRQKALTAS